jgi:dihydrofolate synthase/folylpolyglutamate synthase
MDWEKFLFSLSRFGIKLGLGPTEQFAYSLGNPQNQFRSVHIGGSNGKGSTSTFIYEILKKKYRAGLYTSPHLRTFNERIIVDDIPIDSDFIEKFTKSQHSKIIYNDSLTQLTFFEYTTVMAFKYFQERGVEFASIEVGLGGRLDSTNIINPEASVITSISLEHADKLGGKIEDISREKGGIIKSGKPIVLGKMPDSAKSILRNIAKERRSPIREVDDCNITNLEYSLNGTSFDLQTEMDKYKIKLRALGEHQVTNATSAILAYESISSGIGKDVAVEALRETVIPGRFEIRSRKPLMILDGAHNSEASHLLVRNIRRYNIKNPLIIIGLLRDKNSYNILQNLSEVSDSVVVTEPNEKERKKDSDDLRKEASFFFKEIEVSKTPKEALNIAVKSGRDTIITGSLYLVGEMEVLLDEKMRSKKVPVEKNFIPENEGSVE